MPFDGKVEGTILSEILPKFNVFSRYLSTRSVMDLSRGLTLQLKLANVHIQDHRNLRLKFCPQK